MTDRWRQLKSLCISSDCGIIGKMAITVLPNSKFKCYIMMTIHSLLLLRKSLLKIECFEEGHFDS